MSSPQFEINQPEPGHALFIGRDPGATEMRRGQPFVGAAGTQVFNPCLDEAGWLRSEINIANVVGTQPSGNDFSKHDPLDIEKGLVALEAAIVGLQPNIIVTMGNEAAFALVPDWPTRGGIGGASGIEDRRGYVWRSRPIHRRFYKVLTTVHPAAVLRTWVPWRVLLKYDFERAREIADVSLEELRPEREVVVVA